MEDIIKEILGKEMRGINIDGDRLRNIPIFSYDEVEGLLNELNDKIKGVKE